MFGPRMAISLASRARLCPSGPAAVAVSNQPAVQLCMRHVRTFTTMTGRANVHLPLNSMTPPLCAALLRASPSRVRSGAGGAQAKTMPQGSPHRQCFFLQQLQKRPYSVQSREKFRNVAICAHVDAGKTTLVDSLLRQSKSISDMDGERVMDSNALERERGITILSKWTSLRFRDMTFNVVDTPGHADFSGEVERVLSLVDSILLLVDAREGVMPQTKFILGKALSRGLNAIVVINKVDRESDLTRLGIVENEILDLFIALGANEAQCEFSVLYSSAKIGWAVKSLTDERKDMMPLFETIVEKVPPPKLFSDENPDAPRDNIFRMLVSNMDFDKVFGKILIGKIHSGTINVGDKIQSLDSDGNVIEEGRVFKLISRQGLSQFFIDSGIAGDIVGISGLTTSTIANTIIANNLANEKIAPLHSFALDPPIVSVFFNVNDSPLAGKEGKPTSALQLKERLAAEADRNITVTIRHSDDRDSFEVLARGEMQIGVLAETMRREGFEIAISPPRVIFKQVKDNNGRTRTTEPLEEVVIDVDDEYSGTVIEKMSIRKGEMTDFIQAHGKSRLVFLCPARTLLGYRAEFKTDTRGTGILNHAFHSYGDYRGHLDQIRKGVLISIGTGTATSYALDTLQARGQLFISPGTRVYEGMIVGEHSRDGDLEVNPCREKALTNVRSTEKEEKIKLSKPRDLTLEETITYVQDDELIEVTPKNIRLRKKLLDPIARKSQKRKTSNLP